MCAEVKRGCGAKKSIHEIPGSMRVVYQEDHNHEPPVVPRVRPEVKKRAMEQLATGSKVGAIHKRLVVDTPQATASRKDIPTVQQLYSWKHQIITRDLPTG